MRNDNFYYDGPVKDSGRTLEEIERDLEKEKKQMEKQEWPKEYDGT